MLPITLLVSLFAITVLVIIMVIVMMLIVLVVIIVIVVIVVVVVSSPCGEQGPLVPVTRSVAAMMTAMMPNAISGIVIVVSRVKEMTVILVQWPVR